MNFIPKTSKDMRHEETRQEYITRAVFSLTGFGLVCTIFISVIVNILIGRPMWWPIILMVVSGIILTLGWFIFGVNNWRIARYFPPLLFVFLGTYVTFQPRLDTVGVLLYALAITLTAILFNSKIQWLTVLLSSIAHLLATWFHGEYSFELFVSINLIVTICLSGVAILQWLSS